MEATSLGARLVVRALSNAERHAAPGGVISVPLDPVRVSDFLAAQLPPGTLEALETVPGYDFHRFLATTLGAEVRTALVYENVHGDDVGSWDLTVLRIGERGYLVMEGDPDDDAGDPLLAAWEPYGSRAVLADCFGAVYERYLASFPLIAEVVTICAQDLVTREMLCEALRRGLARHPACWSLLDEHAAPRGVPAGERQRLGDLPTEPTAGAAPVGASGPRTSHGSGAGTAMRACSGELEARLRRYCDRAVRWEPGSLASGAGVRRRTER
ncbi:MAG: hypothetical protein QJR03_16200 [Sphaerobacter sp.]|nr:hypothetical protein [Sphaerobacter sp.]